MDATLEEFLGCVNAFSASSWPNGLSDLSKVVRVRFMAVFSQRLLKWYDKHRRVLPWRALPGQAAVPYHVWLSEIMLQQTTVAAAGPYFTKFLQKWPTVGALAAAPQDDVMTAWAGLGYYSRARNLHKCAQVVMDDLGGVFPDHEAALLKLPGIGPYTAAAITAIAFDRPANVVDGNVERVMARVHNLRDPLPGVKTEIKRVAAELVPRKRCGDYAQALMDLGATVCTPKSPKCMLCPVSEVCAGRVAGDPEVLPVRAAKMEKPVRYGVAFLLTRPDGSVFLRRREDRGLLGGMMEVPSTPWIVARGETLPWANDNFLDHAPTVANWQALSEEVRHTFTHFHLRLSVVTARSRARKIPGGVDGVWADAGRLGDYALPSVMKKVITMGRGLA